MEYKQVYKVDNIQRRIILKDPTGTKTGEKRNSAPTEHEFDLANNDTFDSNGNLLSHYDQGKYDLVFCRKLRYIKPIERVAEFLDYQLRNSPNKFALLKRLNTGAIINSHDLKLTPSRQSELVEWLKKKQELLYIPEKLEKLMEHYEQSPEEIAKQEVNWLSEKLKSISNERVRKEFLEGQAEQTNMALTYLLSNPLILEGGNEHYLRAGQLYLEYLESQLNPVANNGSNNLSKEFSKIRWMGNVEQFGYLIGELVAKGYIELPTNAGEGQFSKLAELLSQYFEITVTKGNNKGMPTTIQNLERAINPNTNTLSLKGKAVFTLPPIDDLK